MNPKKIIIIGVIALAIVMATLWAADYYFNTPQPVDEASLRAYADPMTENLLLAINAGNYTAFSRDLDSAMLGSITQQSFSILCANLQSKVGNYTAKAFIRGEGVSGYTIAYYNATYTNEPAGVSVKVVFSQVNGTEKVSGLWFDSPKLRS